MDHHTEEHLHESPWVVTLPLVILAMAALGAGWFIAPMLFGDYCGNAIQIMPQHEAIAKMSAEFHGIGGMMTHAITTFAVLVFLFGGIFTAWYVYRVNTDLPGK